MKELMEPHRPRRNSTTGVAFVPAGPPFVSGEPGGARETVEGFPLVYWLLERQLTRMVEFTVVVIDRFWRGRAARFPSRIDTVEQHPARARSPFVGIPNSCSKQDRICKNGR